MPSRDEDAFVERFLNREIAARDFTHEMHVRAGWSLLTRMSYLQALERCASIIRYMAEREGASQKFNMTITVAFLALIVEHIAATPGASTWREFISANAELLDKAVLTRWYAPERLKSPAAREGFVMPEPRRSRRIGRSA